MTEKTTSAKLEEAQTLLDAMRKGGPNALVCGLQAIAIVRETLGEQHPHLAGAMLSTSYACYESHDMETAENLVRGAMAIWQAHNPEQPEIAICLNNLGRIEEERGNVEEGVRLHKAAVAMRQRLLGDHPDTAFSLTNLGAAQAYAGHFVDAVHTLEEAIACYTRIGRADDPSVAACRQNIEVCRRHIVPIQGG